MVKVPWFLEKKPPPPDTRSRSRKFIERHLPGISIFLMSLTLAAAVLYPYMIITVPSGKVGVLWKRFSGPGIYCWCILARGTVLDPRELREEGLHIIWPWDNLFIYDLRLQSQTETFNAISREGVSLTATITIRYQLQHNSVAVLHKYLGPGYLNSVLKPEIGSRAREVMSAFTAEQVYSTRRKDVEDSIREMSQAKLGDHLDSLIQPEASEQADRNDYKNQLRRSIVILDTLVLGIELPKTIVEAINRKIEQYYVVQEYDFRIEREMKESRRKEIEANGIAAFQGTVSQGISESYLRWRGIEATLQLAQSQNTKIVVIGNAKDGLPIILGNVDTPSPTNSGGTTTTTTPPSGGGTTTTPPSDGGTTQAPSGEGSTTTTSSDETDPTQPGGGAPPSGAGKTTTPSNGGTTTTSSGGGTTTRGSGTTSSGGTTTTNGQTTSTRGTTTGNNGTTSSGGTTTTNGRTTSTGGGRDTVPN